MATIAFLCCTARVIQDRLTGKYSYIDLFDTIRLLPNNQPILQIFYIVGKLSNVDAGRPVIQIRIEDPNGLILRRENLSSDQDLVSGDLAITTFIALQLSNPGRHYIRVSYNGTDLEDEDRFYFDVVEAIQNG